MISYIDLNRHLPCTCSVVSSATKIFCVPGLSSIAFVPCMLSNLTFWLIYMWELLPYLLTTCKVFGQHLPLIINSPDWISIRVCLTDPIFDELLFCLLSRASFCSTVSVAPETRALLMVENVSDFLLTNLSPVVSLTTVIVLIRGICWVWASTQTWFYHIWSSPRSPRW